MLSIITPHYNDLKGIQSLFYCLQKQSSNQWEWIIVDDSSEKSIQQSLMDWFPNEYSDKIKVYVQDEKLNASAARNKGASLANYSLLVFLDSDDSIGVDFVSNRLIEVEEFVVYQYFHICNEGYSKPFSTIQSNFLKAFLQTNFPWQTTAILWNKEFLLKLGGYDSKLILLEDVELSIRALKTGTNYHIRTDNPLDFYYLGKPIDIQRRTAKKVADSVSYFIHKLVNHLTLSTNEKKRLSNYYYLAVRYAVRSKTKKDWKILKQLLPEFKSLKIIDYSKFVIGFCLIVLKEINLLPTQLFLKLNRKVFKY